MKKIFVALLSLKLAIAPVLAQTPNAVISPNFTLGAPPVAITTTANTTLVDCTTSTANSTAATLNGDLLNIAATLTGTITIPGELGGNGVPNGTQIIAQVSGSAGNTGNYLVSHPLNGALPQNIASETMYEAFSPSGCVNGAVLTALNATNTNTAAQNYNLFISSGGTNFLICTAAIPLSSGNAVGVPPVNLLSNAFCGPGLPQDANGNRILIIPRGMKLTVTQTSTAAGTQTFTPIGGAF